MLIQAYPLPRLFLRIELFQLLHVSSSAFPRVALYFENSILKEDLPFLPSAASTVTRLEQNGSKLTVDSLRGVGVPWLGPAMVDGRPWPVHDERTVWLPVGRHTIEPGARNTAGHLTDFNGLLQSAAPTPHGFEFAYQSSSRALAKLDRPPLTMAIDGADQKPVFVDSTLVLPRGQHIVTLVY